MRPLSLLARMGGVDVYKTLKYLEENPEEIQPQYRNGGILKAGEEDVVQRLSGFYKLVEQAKKLGLEVNVWTVDEEEDMRYFIDLGVDYITTDYPERLQALLK